MDSSCGPNALRPLTYGRCAVIPNGIDCTTFYPANQLDSDSVSPDGSRPNAFGGNVPTKPDGTATLGAGWRVLLVGNPMQAFKGCGAPCKKFMLVILRPMFRFARPKIDSAAPVEAYRGRA
jgi:hypothetical protein